MALNIIAAHTDRCSPWLHHITMCLCSRNACCTRGKTMLLNTVLLYTFYCISQWYPVAPDFPISSLAGSWIPLTSISVYRFYKMLGISSCFKLIENIQGGFIFVISYNLRGCRSGVYHMSYSFIYGKLETDFILFLIHVLVSDVLTVLCPTPASSAFTTLSKLLTDDFTCQLSNFMLTSLCLFISLIAYSYSLLILW